MKKRSMTFAPGEWLAWKRLQGLPNVGPATAEDLVRLGIRRLEDLAHRDGRGLYEDLCRLDACRHDPCVEDVFCALCAMAGGARRHVPWWFFSRARKAAANSR